MSTRTTNFLLLTTPLLVPTWFLFNKGTKSLQKTVLYVSIASFLSFLATIKLVPILAKYTVKKLYGKDINKKGTPAGQRKVPESLGIACGIVYLACSVCLQFIVDESKLQEYNASLLSICFMILLGFVDDVLDIPWRYKLIIPAIATLPLLMSYSGETTIKIPIDLSNMIGISRILNLGFLYYIYMFLLLVFCTNAINIHAGINGLEVGQSFIIGVGILIHNIIEASQDETGRYQHLFSIFLILPFISVSMGLLTHNWYPSDVFVGDTYTMFAGMTLAVAGVMGHFSKTLLIFFIPQILNFLYSVPQLFNLFGYTCPRHRLPRYNIETKLLEGIPTHLNLVNGFLCLMGNMSERTLCIVLLIFQSLCCCVGLFIRYRMQYYLF